MKRLKILVPIDFSPTSIAALEAAILLARGSAAKVLVVHVAAVESLTSGFEDLIPSSESDDLSKRLEDACRSEIAVDFERRIIHGPVTRSIVELARSERADLIVMGTHGRHGMEQFLMGSVAQAVMRATSTQVLLVRGAYAAVDVDERNRSVALPTSEK